MSDTEVLQVPDKGLRAGAISIREATGIGIASTAPAYSLAATVGVLIAAVGGAAPWVLALAFLPVLGVALSFRELNRQEPDCGTVFVWVTRAFGKRAGWLTGWAAIMACVLVLGNLAQVAAIYLLDLVGADDLSDDRPAQIVLGLLLLAATAAIAVRGVEISARTQGVMVVLETLALLVFAGFAFAKADGISANLSFGGGEEGIGVALLAAVFLYWGWDSAFSVNEESEDPREVPGRAAVISLIAVVLLYLIVSVAALAYAGRERLSTAQDDFFAVLAGDLLGTTGGSLLVAAVLLSALASMLTTILPTARTVLSMAFRDVLPGTLCDVHPRYQTPRRATWVTTGIAAVLYAVLLAVSDSVLADFIEATGLLISLYFAVTAFAVPVLARRRAAAPGVLFSLVIPVLSGAFFTGLLVYSALESAGLPLLVAVGSMLVGVVLLALQRPHPEGQPSR